MRQYKRYIALALAVFVFSATLSSCSLVEHRQYGVGRESDTNASSGSESEASSDSESTDDVTPPSEPKTITIAAAGDNLIHESVFLDAAKRATNGKEYDFTPMYDGVRSMISSADIAMVNQETPLAGKEYGYSGYPSFNSPREAAEALMEIGFDVIGIANNHSLDKETAGLKATLDYLKTQPVTTIGAYEGESDMYTARIIETQGCKVGFIAFSYGWYNTHVLDSSYGILIPSVTDDELIKKWVADQKAKCDFLVVSVHWGDEYTFQINDAQKHAAELIAEAGADAIIGSHSHTVQPVEWIYNSDGSKTICVYSLGNFISTQLYGYTMVGGIVELTLTENENGKFELTDVVYNPTVTHYSTARDGLQVYLLEDYTEELASQHGCRKDSPEFSLATAKYYVTSTIAAEFLPKYLK